MLVLGIHDGTHDAGAALVHDGELVAACNEERFTREKGAGGWPARSIAACLAAAGGAQVDRVAFPGFVNPNPALRVARPLQRRWKLDDGLFWQEDPGPLGRLSEWIQFASPFPRLTSEDAAPLARPLRAALAHHTRSEGIRAPVQLLDHHLCHAAGAWRSSGWDEALVLVADGVGDGLGLTVWVGRGGRLHRLAAMPYPHSYGLLYATFTGFLGFRPFRHEGKLTGLAALGDADAVDVPWPFVGPPEARRFTQQFGAPLRPWLERLRAFRREDVSAWLQRGIERDLVAMTDHFVAVTGLRRVALAGGVFANVRLNQALGERVDELWVFPHMGDGGLAAGAALQAWAERAGDPAPIRLRHPFLGPTWDEPAMEAALREAGVAWRRAQDLEGEVAARLAGGQIVARFEGAMEFGPRALGNRSILASGADARMTERLNVALTRSEFMPFAPVILDEEADAWIEGLASVRGAARFMTVTAQARPNLAAACPAAVHVDGSLRPQLVDAVTTPGLHRTLLAFASRTGVPALINTSFNLHEEPIVASPEEALATWRAARIDALVLGPFLVAA